ncbi:MAG: TnpV protein [bacterium]|nr:TnpV protein [bacterium]
MCVIKNNEGTNKYALLRLNYLKEHKKALYTTLLMKNELTNHLVSVSNESEKRLNFLMDSYKNMTEEIILEELIYI